MATKTIHVCDICGKDAVSKRTIDVCSDHSKTPAASTTDGRSKPKSLVACPKCGEKFKAGAGLSAHMRRAHAPKSSAKKSTAKKR